MDRIIHPGYQARRRVGLHGLSPASSRFLTQCSRHFSQIDPDTPQQQEGQIVQSQLDLADFLRAPWKGALSLRVRIPPGNCRSSR